MNADVEAIAREAGQRALQLFGERGQLEIEAKGPLDLVSRADRELETMIADRLHRLYPDDGILGEEGRSIPSRSGRTWVLDPIDGTFNFVRGGPEWGVSIGLYDPSGPLHGVVNLPVLAQVLSGGVTQRTKLNGSPLPFLSSFDAQRASLSIGLSSEMPLDYALDAIRFARREGGFAVRACGSCIAGMMEVARGETDVYLGLAEHSWDVMAALPIVMALGAACTLDWSRTTLADSLYFAAGKPGAVERLLPFVSRQL